MTNHNPITHNVAKTAMGIMFDKIFNYILGPETRIDHDVEPFIASLNSTQEIPDDMWDIIVSDIQYNVGKEYWIIPDDSTLKIKINQYVEALTGLYYSDAQHLIYDIIKDADVTGLNQQDVESLINIGTITKSEITTNNTGNINPILNSIINMFATDLESNGIIDGLLSERDYKLIFETHYVVITVPTSNAYTPSSITERIAYENIKYRRD